MSAAAVFIFKTASLKKNFLQKLIIKKMVNKPLFSSVVAKDLTNWLLRCSQSEQKKVLNELAEEKYESIIAKIKDKKLKKTLKLVGLGKEDKNLPSSEIYKILEAFAALQKGSEKKAVALLAKPVKKNETIKALRQLMTAEIALASGDLQTVADEITSCLKVFKRKNMPFEEAKAYFVLGTAYRISGIYDTADFMLRSALALYQNISCDKKVAETYGTLGMLMAAQNRFDEADSFYQKALKTVENDTDKELYYFIVSQRALNFLYQKKEKEAESLAQRALKGHSSAAGKAFASEILARVFWTNKKWEQQLKFAKQAEKLYRQEKNAAAAFECQYLTAEAYVEQEKLSEAEEILRDLIKQEKDQKSCFYVANAMTLLGLILLQKKDIKGAKTIFNQALNQELYNERNIGAAVDYMNLAIVEKESGNLEEMQKNIKNALAYAKENDENLWKKFNAFLN